MPEDTAPQNQQPVPFAGAAPVGAESAQPAAESVGAPAGFQPAQPAGGQPAAASAPETAGAQPAGAQAGPYAQAANAAGPQQHDAQAAPIPPFAGGPGVSAQQPGYAPAPVQPPVPQLTGGMKFGYFAVGFLGNLLGILIAWLINADKHPAIRNAAIKWSVVGFAATFVIGIVLVIAVAGMIGALFTAIGAGVYAYDPASYYYAF